MSLIREGQNSTAHITAIPATSPDMYWLCPCCKNPNKKRKDFYTNRARKSGLSDWCRECSKASSKIGYQKKKYKIATDLKSKRNECKWQLAASSQHHPFDLPLAVPGNSDINKFRQIPRRRLPGQNDAPLFDKISSAVKALPGGKVEIAGAGRSGHNNKTINAVCDCCGRDHTQVIFALPFQDDFCPRPKVRLFCSFCYDTCLN